jgi:hypothetical protein
MIDSHTTKCLNKKKPKSGNILARKGDNPNWIENELQGTRKDGDGYAPFFLPPSIKVTVLPKALINED